MLPEGGTRHKTPVARSSPHPPAVRRGVVRKDSRASNARCSKQGKVLGALPNARKVQDALCSKGERCP